MNRYQLWVLGSFGLILILFAVWSVTVSASDAPAKAIEDVEELIRQLGSKSFETREAASRQLLTRDDAIPALERAQKANDPEIARRATDILNEIRHKGEKRALAKLTEFAKNGEIDRAIELLACHPTWDDIQNTWQPMTGFAEKLIDLGQESFGKPMVPVRNEHLPVGAFAQFVKKVGPDFRSSNIVTLQSDPDADRHGCLVVRAKTIILKGSLSYNLLTATSVVRVEGVEGSLKYSVVFAGDTLEAVALLSCVIVCDGDVKVTEDLCNCLVIARGDVHCEKASVRDSRIITSGRFYPPRDGDVRKTIIKEKEKTPLGFVKFLDPASVGITVEAVDGGLRVKTADDKKAFGIAGLRIDDLLIALDDKKFDDKKLDSVESFRRVLRTKLAEGGKMLLKVRRDGHTVEIPVTCLD